MVKWIAAQGRTEPFIPANPAHAPNPVERWKACIQCAMFEIGHAPVAFTLDCGRWWASPQLPESVFSQDEIDDYWEDLDRALVLIGEPVDRYGDYA